MWGEGVHNNFPLDQYLSKVCTKLEKQSVKCQLPINVVFKCSTFSHFLRFF